jgi:hypothetical protein
MAREEEMEQDEKLEKLEKTEQMPQAMVNIGNAADLWRLCCLQAEFLRQHKKRSRGQTTKYLVD